MALNDDILVYYTRAGGWFPTSAISKYFKGVDFYKGKIVVVNQMNQIIADLAVSVKTTTVADVNKWLNSGPIQKNITFPRQGLGPSGLPSNGYTMNIKRAEIHIYMPKQNLTPQLIMAWTTTLSPKHPDISFFIYSMEQYIK